MIKLIILFCVLLLSFVFSDVVNVKKNAKRDKIVNSILVNPIPTFFQRESWCPSHNINGKYYNIFFYI